MKVLVTGGAGYIGSVLVRQLLGKGYQVRAFDNLKFGGDALYEVMLNPDFEFMFGDVKNSSEVEKALEGVDAIAHLAAIVGDPACKKFFDDNFVITHITVSESKGKENLENAGGADMMEKYNGKDMGLPYWVIVDKNADLLFDSRFKVTAADGKERNTIIGCPATQSEVDKFIEILKKTTALTEPQLAIIAKRFRQNEK